MRTKPSSFSTSPKGQDLVVASTARLLVCKASEASFRCVRLDDILLAVQIDQSDGAELPIVALLGRVNSYGPGVLENAQTTDTEGKFALYRGTMSRPSPPDRPGRRGRC